MKDKILDAAVEGLALVVALLMLAVAAPMLLLLWAVEYAPSWGTEE